VVELCEDLTCLRAWLILAQVPCLRDVSSHEVDDLANRNNVPSVFLKCGACRRNNCILNLGDRVASYSIYSLLFFGVTACLASFVLREHALNILALVIAVHVCVILTPVIEIQRLSCTYVLIVAVERDDQKVATL
jgi:hypothetical protein